ncbi:MAG: hypothetical protein R3A13_08980 [Bdellovibrionota bacterium]
MSDFSDEFEGETLIHRRVAAARAGKNPTVIGKMKTGWAVLGDVQFLEGYCLLYPDPVVPHLNAMEFELRKQFLHEMTVLGDAVLEVTDAVRINYEMLGNLEPALHAHVFPRFDTESDDLKTKPVWFYDWENARKFDEAEDAEMIERLRGALDKRDALV